MKELSQDQESVRHIAVIALYIKRIAARFVPKKTKTLQIEQRKRVGNIRAIQFGHHIHEMHGLRNGVTQMNQTRKTMSE